MKQADIKKGNTGFNPVFILSFENEKSFVEATEKDYLQEIEPRERKKVLRDVYRIAKLGAIKPEE